MAVYEDIFAILIPRDWPRAGQWCVTTRRYTLSSPCVSFFAPPGAPSDRLRGALDHFTPRLPDGVTFLPN